MADGRQGDRVWTQDDDGDWTYASNVVCRHAEPPRWKVVYGWGRVAVFDTLDEAKAFVERYELGWGDGN